MQTLPFYICEETYIQCVNNHPNDAEGQQTCKNNEQCGTLNATAKSTSATTSSTAATSQTGAPSPTGPSSSPSAHNSAPMLADQRVVTGTLAAVLMVAFKLLL